MARIEGTGIKEPSKEAKVANLNFLRNPKKFLQQKVDQKLDSMTKSGKTPFGTSIGGSAVGEEGLGRFGNPNELSDASNEIKNRFNLKLEEIVLVQEYFVEIFSWTVIPKDILILLHKNIKNN